MIKKVMIEIKLDDRNMMNTWIESLVGYVPWLNERETPVYRQNRKCVDVHKALHLNDDAEKLYVESIVMKWSKWNCINNTTM